MYKSVVYQGEMVLGEVEIYPVVENTQAMMMIELMREVRITHFSQPSERCSPLAVLQTITSSGVCFKMESKTSESLDTPLYLLHSTCIMENKTAVMTLGGEELHLVAMFSRNNDKPYPCFWGFNVASGLYDSCLIMLNLRCLGIVFDLDETLIVANTMRSFEDRIDALQRKINVEVDPQRIAGMLAEVKRYQDDKSILKQYVESDQVVENGKVVKIQSEIVPAFSDNHQPIIRPLIRLPEKNIILTRINPQIRDTSVLVRLRPAWEELRSYLTAKGRKRFEVYVCTMAERDYALEMWRLLDPDSNLINSKDLQDRIVCVKAGLKKSLFNVFQDGLCHPKMALVIDDRLKVWDEKDQPRVHVVPAFAPYYAPQAEANNATPVLCVARNVACNVRGGFFKDFDEVLLQKIPEIAYEDDFRDTPSPPDVSNYLVSEDDSYTSNGNRDSLSFDGMADSEVERRLKEAISSLITPSTETSLDPGQTQTLRHTSPSPSSLISLQTEQPPMMPFGNVSFPQVASSLAKPVGPTATPEPSLHSSPSREEGEVPESELDPDTRRRLLILQHGQDTRDHVSSEPPFPVRPPVQVPMASVQQRHEWFSSEQEMGPQQLSRVMRKEFPVRPEPLHMEKNRPRHSFFPKVGSSMSSARVTHEKQRLPNEGYHRNRFRLNRSRLNPTVSGHHFFSGEDIPVGRSSSGNRDFEFEPEEPVSNAETPVGVLQDVAMKSGIKVEFRSSLVASTELQFSVQVWFSGEKIGEGIGRTRREAQHRAAESSLKNLDEHILYAKVDPGSGCDEAVKFPTANGNGMETLKKSMGSISALKELCIMEGLGVTFQPQFPPPANSLLKDEVHAQVEIDGQVLGKGIGLTWDEAKIQAAEKALVSLRSMLGQCNQKRQSSPRSLQGVSKRMKQEFPRVIQRLPSSGRYGAQNTSPVP